MKVNPLRILTMGLSGLVVVGLLSFQQSASADEDAAYAKRDDDGQDVVLVADDDARDTRTGTRTAGTNSGNSGDNSRSGRASGVDDSRSGNRVKDWTGDNTNTRKRDWSQNQTNDRSRHNTR